jgi:hypothetical protein
VIDVLRRPITKSAGESILDDQFQHYVKELKRFQRRHHQLRGIYLIHDGDPSHSAALTRKYFRYVPAGGGTDSPWLMRLGSTTQRSLPTRSNTII